MKKLSILFLSFVALATAVTSCSNNDDNPAPAASTVLELKMKDANGDPVEGAKVVLFGDANGTVKVDSITTGTDGIAKFSKNLKSQIYYFDASKEAGCLSNIYSITSTVDSAGNPAAIPANKTTSFDVELSSIGQITFTNNSGTDAYNVYLKVGGNYSKVTKLGFAAGQNSATYVLPIGTYDVKFVKLDSSNNEIPAEFVEKTANSVTACGSVTVTVP